MPADNVRGFRPDIIALLKQLRSGMYRFPGGNFLSAHVRHSGALSERLRHFLN